MSKPIQPPAFPGLDDDDDDADLPPPYTLSTTTTTPSTPLTTHLAALPARLRAAAAHHRASRSADAAALSAPHVAAFVERLTRLASASSNSSGGGRAIPIGTTAELVLVPAAAVPRGWALSGAAERRREGEVVRVARVEGPVRGGGEKGSSEKKGGAPARDDADDDDDDDGDHRDGRQDFDAATEFDDWGRWGEGAGAGMDDEDLLWWRDEAMAAGAAAHLRPGEPVRVERRQVQAAVENARDGRKKGWGWMRRRSDAPAARAAAAPPLVAMPAGPAPGPGVAAEVDEPASITVRADEVTFRKESELGVWESMNGFAILVTVRIGGT
ncbi:hypothetical protein QBC33DRAFT_582754 [Phialemonium atrogriseum]|uniref:Uncharacterized protein n=1 Tax=Phialemonium atrogriseum TaxID=1093897 RepID=A0AAJ0CB54_9PEZI|nr:uncharacterized protein QBC33DRAFT_582754 [Phialemonium atrogriseum]KAK1772263.1 hypothetical protein QBC33DRAFT_582754 [Phialemonium atrogriseum]